MTHRRSRADPEALLWSTGVAVVPAGPLTTTGHVTNTAHMPGWGIPGDLDVQTYCLDCSRSCYVDPYDGPSPASCECCSIDRESYARTGRAQSGERMSYRE